MRRIERMMAEDLGREPTDEELSEETGVPMRKLSALRRASLRTTSLDAPLVDGEKTTVSDTIGDEKAATPLEALSLKNSTDQLDDLLGTARRTGIPHYRRPASDSTARSP